MAAGSEPHKDALSALENLGNAPAAQNGKDHESVDASGFVGMLARGNQNEADPAGQPRANFPQPQPKQPTPQPAPSDASSSVIIAHGLSSIPMAREIVIPRTQAAFELEAEPPVQPQAEPEPAHESEPPMQIATPARPERTKPVAGPPVGRGARRRRKVPGWYRAAIPISFTMGSLLFLIGAWALIAVICFYGKATGFPGVPTPDEGILMPFLMTFSLPVAIALAVMGMIMSHQIRAEDQADDSANARAAGE